MDEITKNWLLLRYPRREKPVSQVERQIKTVGALPLLPSGDTLWGDMACFHLRKQIGQMVAVAPPLPSVASLWGDAVPVESGTAAKKNLGVVPRGFSMVRI